MTVVNNQDGIENMSPRQFKFAISGLRIKEENQEIARRILVEGESIPDIVEETGMKKQTIHSLVNRVWENHDKLVEENELVEADGLISKEDLRVLRELEKKALKGII